jgi:hypothetical protein
MDRRLLWIVSAALGAVTVVFTSFALIAVLAWGLLLVPLVLRGDRLVALSGAVTGFGAVWTTLIGSEWTSSSADTRAFWLAVGVVPLVVGCGSLALLLTGRLVTAARRSS